MEKDSDMANFMKQLGKFEEGQGSEEGVLAAAIAATRKKRESEKGRLAEKETEMTPELEAKTKAFKELQQKEYQCFQNTSRRGPAGQTLFNMVNPLEAVEEKYRGFKLKPGEIRPAKGSMAQVGKDNVEAWCCRCPDSVLAAAKLYTPDMVVWWRKTQKAATVLEEALLELNVNWLILFSRQQMLITWAVAVAAKDLNVDVMKI